MVDRHNEYLTFTLLDHGATRCGLTGSTKVSTAVQLVDDMSVLVKTTTRSSVPTVIWS